jgi:RHS repeat-associated protein
LSSISREIAIVRTATAINTWGRIGFISCNVNPSAGTPASVFYTFDERGDAVTRMQYIGSGNSAAASGQIWAPFGQQEYLTPSASAVAGDPYAGMGAQYGDYTDQETGLVFCQNRYYDPSYGRWLTRDPIGTAGGENLYAYCHNDPVNLIDPDGTMPLQFGSNAGSSTTPTNVPQRFIESSENAESSVEASSGATQGGVQAAAGAELGEAAEGLPGIIQVGASAAGELAGYIASGYQPQGPLTAVGDALGRKLGDALFSGQGEGAGGVYALKDRSSGAVVRTGRTNNLHKREGEHLRDTTLGQYMFTVLGRTDCKAAQRGLEQLAHMHFAPPLNKVGGIDPRNPRRQQYIDAALEEFGQ